MNLQLVFTSTTGRSGTKYLANIINTNAENASAEHDPFPRGYGDPIKWYDDFDNEKLKKLVKRKLKRLKRGKRYRKILNFPIMREISGRRKSQSRVYLKIHRWLRNYVSSVDIKEIYLESTHAFIKSFGEEMFNLHPDLKIVHLTRNPLEVAKSFYNRKSIPDSKNIFLLDPNFKRNELKIPFPMSDFQKCLWYWFETELRHKSFVENHTHIKVIDIDINDLNNTDNVRKLFQSLGVIYKEIKLTVDRNVNIQDTTLSTQDLKEAEEFIRAIPNWVFNKIGDQYSLKSLFSLD